jgi:hypothetical protein
VIDPFFTKKMMKNRKSVNQTNHNNNEDDIHDNDALLAALLTEVKSLNSNAKEISGELKEHSTLFDRVSVRLGRARDSIAKTTQRLIKGESVGGHVSHVWILLVFAFVVFFFIYMMLKFKR